MLPPMPNPPLCSTCAIGTDMSKCVNQLLCLQDVAPRRVHNASHYIDIIEYTYIDLSIHCLR